MSTQADFSRAYYLILFAMGFEFPASAGFYYLSIHVAAHGL